MPPDDSSSSRLLLRMRCRKMSPTGPHTPLRQLPEANCGQDRAMQQALLVQRLSRRGQLYERAGCSRCLGGRPPACALARGLVIQAVRARVHNKRRLGQHALGGRDAALVLVAAAAAVKLGLRAVVRKPAGFSACQGRPSQHAQGSARCVQQSACSTMHPSFSEALHSAAAGF